MARIKIILDSTADLPLEWKNMTDLQTIPLHILWDGDQDELDERDEKAIHDFWKRLRTAEKVPKTSQPTPAKFTEMYNKIFEDGYDSILVITISAKLSGTYNSATLAAKDQTKPIAVWDSRLASSPMSLAVRRARELADLGKDVNTIKQILEKERNDNQFMACFYVSDFDYLRKGGRISRFQSFVGSMLKLRVTLSIDHNGELIPFGKTRGSERAQEMVSDEITKYIPSGSRVSLAMMHTDNLEESQETAKKLAKRYHVVDTVYTPTGKVISTHVGPGTVGFGVYWIKDG